MPSILQKIKRVFTGNNILYYPGCLTKFKLPEIESNYKKILTALGIEFISLPDDEFCCGSPVLNAGYDEDFYNLKLKNMETFRKYGVGKIITNCPSCYHMLKEFYPDIEVEHIIITIHNNVDKISPKFTEDICYHDPCHLGRKSGIYDQPREILQKLGFNVIEFNENKENSLCCGGGAGLVNNYNEISNKVAKLRISQCTSKTLITPCPMCYLHMKNNSQNVKVLEFSEVLL